MSDWMIAVALATLGLNLLIAIATATWTVSRSSPSRKDLSDVKDELSKRIEEANHDYGETVHAIRKKVEEVELWARDHLADKRGVETLLDLVKDYSGLVVKVETMWDFIMDRARIEARQGGFVKRESPLVLTELGKQAIAPILPAAINFCRQHPEFREMTINELEIELARHFREKLAEEVCEPNGIYMGACMVLLIEGLRAAGLIPPPPSPLRPASFPHKAA